MSNGRLAAILAYASGSGITVALMLGQWEETFLWVLVIIVSAVLLNREIK